MAPQSQAQFSRFLAKAYGWYTFGFLLFVLALAAAERFGLPKIWIGYLFLIATVGVYA